MTNFTLNKFLTTDHRENKNPVITLYSQNLGHSQRFEKFCDTLICCTALTRLCLIDNHLDHLDPEEWQYFCDSLGNCPSLRTINIDGNNLSQEKIDQVKQIVAKHNTVLDDEIDSAVEKNNHQKRLVTTQVSYIEKSITRLPSMHPMLSFSRSTSHITRQLSRQSTRGENGTERSVSYPSSTVSINAITHFPPVKKLKNKKPINVKHLSADEWAGLKEFLTSILQEACKPLSEKSASLYSTVEQVEHNSLRRNFIIESMGSLSQIIDYLYKYLATPNQYYTARLLAALLHPSETNQKKAEPLTNLIHTIDGDTAVLTNSQRKIVVTALHALRKNVPSPTKNENNLPSPLPDSIFA